MLESIATAVLGPDDLPQLVQLTHARMSKALRAMARVRGVPPRHTAPGPER